MDDDLEQLVSKVEALHAGPDDLLVLTCPGAIDDETQDRLRRDASELLGGRRVLVLSDGMQLSTVGQHRQLERIERSLAALQTAVAAVLEVLAKDEAPPEGRTLDGDLFPGGERDQTRPL